MSVDLLYLEQQKAAILTDLQTWPAEHLRFRLSDGGWSAVQVLDHLAKTERSIQARMREGLATPHRITVRDRLGTLFLNRVFRSDRKVKVPASATMTLPEPHPQLPDIVSQWDASRRELDALLSQHNVNPGNLGVFRHPVAGWMSVAGVLDFFSVHMHHHTFQINALRNASQSAGPP